MKQIKRIDCICITGLLLLSFHTTCQTVRAKISCGELVDKITILTIKKNRITNSSKLQNVHTELESLQDTYNKYIGNCIDVVQLQAELQIVNEALWDIEDAIRIKERNQEFDNEFIALARSVYITNDKRCALKKRIDELLGSHITEEKSYEEHAIST